MEFLLDCISLRLNLDEFFSCFICIFVCFSFFVKLIMSTSLETFHRLIEISSCIHLQTLLFPRLTVRWNHNSFEDLYLFSLSCFFARLNYDLFANQLNHIKFLPYSLQSNPGVSLLVIIDDQSFSRSGDGSIEQFQLRT